MFQRMDFDNSKYVEKAFVEATFIQRGLISFHKIWKLMAHEYKDAATWKEFLVLMHFGDMLTSGNLDKVPSEHPPAYWEGLDEILERGIRDSSSSQKHGQMEQKIRFRCFMSRILLGENLLALTRLVRGLMYLNLHLRALVMHANPIHRAIIL
jgi:hypothetical protein